MPDGHNKAIRAAREIDHVAPVRVRITEACREQKPRMYFSRTIIYHVCVCVWCFGARIYGFCMHADAIRTTAEQKSLAVFTVECLEAKWN